MPTQTQKLFNLFMQQNYPELMKEMPMRDLMHDAYVTVYHLRTPYIPTPEQFRSRMRDAYHRHFLYEFNHAMQFTLPDPRIWLYMEENECDEPTEETAHNHSLSDLSQNSLQNLFAFVRKNFHPAEYEMFKMAVTEQMSYKDIAVVLGCTTKQVKEKIEAIEKAIRMHRRPVNKQQTKKQK